MRNIFEFPHIYIYIDTSAGYKCVRRNAFACPPKSVDRFMNYAYICIVHRSLAVLFPSTPNASGARNLMDNTSFVCASGLVRGQKFVMYGKCLDPRPTFGAPQKTACAQLRTRNVHTEKVRGCAFAFARSIACAGKSPEASSR